MANDKLVEAMARAVVISQGGDPDHMRSVISWGGTPAPRWKDWQSEMEFVATALAAALREDEGAVEAIVRACRKSGPWPTGKHALNGLCNYIEGKD